MLLTTNTYNAFKEFAKDYFERYKIQATFSYLDIVHNILVENPELCLEELQNLFKTFFNKEKRATRNATMHEQDIDRERIAVRDAQIDLKNDPVKHEKNKKGKNRWHCCKRKKDKTWAHDRDIHNNEYQKEKYKTDEEFRLKKKLRDHDYYVSKHPKTILVNDE